MIIQWKDTTNLYNKQQSQEMSQVQNINEVARQLWYADPKNKGATMKTSDREAMVAKLLKGFDENRGAVEIIEEEDEDAEEGKEEDQVPESDEEEDEGVTMKLPVKVQQPVYRQVEDEDEDEGVTLRLPPKKQTAAPQKVQEVIEEQKGEDGEEEEDEGTQKLPKAGQKKPVVQVEKVEEQVVEEDDGTLKQETKPKAPKPVVQLTNVGGLMVPTKIRVTSGMTKVTTKNLGEKKLTMAVRSASNLNEITLPVNEVSDHELLLYKGNRIIHSQIYEDYKDETEYTGNKALLIKRACQRQTIIKTDQESFEAQDTEKKVETFLKQYSRYFKDVVQITQLAKGGEAIVYTLEHSLPDELVIKCPILTEEQKDKFLTVAFNGILYESQTINLNPHKGHVVNNVEEIILYNEKKGIITNYCVIVEKAKYTLENVVKDWAGQKFSTKLQANDTTWIHKNQDFYTPEKLSFYFFQTFLATSYLHKRNIYYGDMKGANLLIFRNQEIKIGDLGISIKMKADNTSTYVPKGISEGFCMGKIKDAWNAGVGVNRDVLIENDKFAISQTFEKSLQILQKVAAIREENKRTKPYYLEMARDAKNKDLSITKIVEKWAQKLDDDEAFKNKLCLALKREYKFLGLPKVHLMLDQKLMQNFYMNKQIVYKREVDEDDTKDPGSDYFVVRPSGRKTEFPFAKEGVSAKQAVKEKIDFYWALKTAKSTRDEIRKEHENILEQELGLTRKRINAKMHDFKDFEIKKAFADKEKSLNQIKILDAISGPNNDGVQIELQHKLCLEIAKGLGSTNLADYFLKRVEQIFILEYNESEKESSFKEQHVKRLKDQIKKVYEVYKEEGVTRTHEIQYAFYSYFMYKDLHQTTDLIHPDIFDKKPEKRLEKIANYVQQIKYLSDAMQIFKNLMGENIELQNIMIHRKAVAHIQIGDMIERYFEGEEKKEQLEKQSFNYREANDAFKRLYLTTKSLQSFHDYVYAFRKMIKTSEKEIKQLGVTTKHPYSEKDVEEEVRFKYDLHSGFLLFKEFFNKYYDYVPGFGLENDKIRTRLEYLKEVLDEDNEKNPLQFFKLFRSFLKQINDNSLEDVSKKRTHLYSYDTYLPKNSYLKLKHSQFDVEKIDLNKSILSDDVEFLLNQQRDKITLKKLIFHFDINRFIVCIDSEFYNSRTQKTYATDHYKELKQYEATLEIPPFVYPIAINIIDDAKQGKKKNTDNNADKEKERKEKEDREAEEKKLKEMEATHSIVMVQLSNYTIFKIYIDKDLKPQGFDKGMDIFESGFEEKEEIEKTLVIFNRLTKPFNDYVNGTFQFFDPKVNKLQIQNYFFKLSKRQFIISLMRHCFAKLQIVHEANQIDFSKSDSLIVYRDKYLFSSELLQNEKIKKDLLSGNDNFNWLFSQEKLLNQRKRNFKQYMKDVRNHLIYHMREYFCDGEDEKYQPQPEGDDKTGKKFKPLQPIVVQLQEQMGKTIDVMKCFNEAVEKMFAGLKQRYQFVQDKTAKTVTVGYSIVEKQSELREATQLSSLEQQAYFYQVIVLLRSIKRNGFNIDKISSVKVGQDYLLVQVNYSTQNFKKDDKGADLKDLIDGKLIVEPQYLNRQELSELIDKYLGDKAATEFSADLLNVFRQNPQQESGEVLREWQTDLAANLTRNLSEAIKKDKIFPHLMRVIPLPVEFKPIFQSELYSYLASDDQTIELHYNESDLLLLKLMLLKMQYKTKTPSQTIRNLKYKQQAEYNSGLFIQLFNDFKQKTEADAEQKPLLQFYKEQVFRYHAFDTTKFLLGEWTAHIAALYEVKEYSEFANLFFYSSYDYYSININVLLREMEDFFSVMTEDVIRTTINKIFQIVLARIQGSLKKNRDQYVQFFKRFYPEGSEDYTNLIKKIDEYVDQEYKDGDYENYEKEYNEYSACGETIETIKEVMPPVAAKNEARVDQDRDLTQLYNGIVRDQLLFAEQLITKAQIASKLSKSKNKIIVAYTYEINKQNIQQVNRELVGNLLLKKLVLKTSRTKHRIFNQHRIFKKYVASLEEQVQNLQHEHVLAKRNPNAVAVDQDRDDKEREKDLLDRLYQVMDKNVIVSLQDQYDHEYLPKYREVFNRLDEWHRFTNFDDLERVVSALAHKDSEEVNRAKEEELRQQQHNEIEFRQRQEDLTEEKLKSIRKKHEVQIKDSRIDPEDSKFYLNRYVDIKEYPNIRQVRFYLDGHNVIHITAEYHLEGGRIQDQGQIRGLNTERINGLHHVNLDLKEGESIHDIAAVPGQAVQRITDFTITLARDGKTTEVVSFEENLVEKRTPVESKEARRVISFSGLATEQGLLNFNLYFYNCLNAPEEKHLFIEEDSDNEDYFNERNF